MSISRSLSILLFHAAVLGVWEIISHTSGYGMASMMIGVGLLIMLETMRPFPGLFYATTLMLTVALLHFMKYGTLYRRGGDSSILDTPLVMMILVGTIVNIGLESRYHRIQD